MTKEETGGHLCTPLVSLPFLIIGELLVVSGEFLLFSLCSWYTKHLLELFTPSFYLYITGDHGRQLLGYPRLLTFRGRPEAFLVEGERGFPGPLRRGTAKGCLPKHTRRVHPRVRHMKQNKAGCACEWPCVNASDSVCAPHSPASTLSL